MRITVKRIISVWTAAVTAAAFLPLTPIFAADDAQTGTTSDGFTYQIEGEKVSITGYEGDLPASGALTLPTTVAGQAVNDIGRRAFENMTELNAVTLPDTLRTIDWYAFQGSGISEITLPEGFVRFEVSVFDGCENLKTLTIPTTFDKGNSYGNWNDWGPLAKSCIETIVFAEGSKIVTGDLCRHMQTLKNVVIPDTVETIGDDAFYDCPALTSVDIPDSVTKIESGAFADCTGIAAFDLPDSILEIGNSVFESTAITEIELPKNLEILGSNVFKNCQSLTALTVPKTLQKADYALENSAVTDLNFESGMEIIPDYIGANAPVLKNVTIPDTVTELGDRMCEGCLNLKTITIPASVQVSPGAPFRNSALSAIHFDDGMTRIPDGICDDAINLTAIDYPAAVTEIGEKAFRNCISMKAISIPDTVTKIGYAAFSQCIGAKSVTIPVSVTEMGSNVFEKTTALESVFLPASLDVTANKAENWFRGSGIRSITFADEMEQIPSGVCYDCANLTEIHFPTAPTKILSNAFRNCTSLTALQLPDSITSIGSDALNGCTALADLHLPASCSDYSGGCLGGLTSLKYLYVPHPFNEVGYSYSVIGGSGVETLEFADGIETIYGTFSALPKLRKVILPDSVKTIERKAFFEDYALSEITLPQSLETLGSNVFGSCISLREVTIPKSVKSTGSIIGNGSGIETVIFENGMTEIPADICNGASNLQAVEIPSSVTKIGARAFANCPRLETLKMPQKSIAFEPTAFENTDNLWDERVSIYRKGEAFVNRTLSADGKYVHYTVSYALNPRFISQFTKGTLEIRTDTSKIVSESLPEGIEPTSSPLVVTFTEPTGVFRFSMLADSEKEIPVNVKFCAYLESATPYCKNIISEGYQKSALTLTAPAYLEAGSENLGEGVVSMWAEIGSQDEATFSESNKRTFTVYGNAPLGSKVSILMDGTEIGTAEASPYTGKYTLELTVFAKQAGNTSKIQAVVGDTKSEASTITWETARAQIEKVILHHNNNHMTYSLDVTDAFLGGTVPYLAYNPKMPLGFEVTLSDNHQAAVYVTSTVDGDISGFPLTFDEASGTWSGEGFFATTLPGKLNISVIPSKISDTLTQTRKSNGNLSLKIGDTEINALHDTEAPDIVDAILADADAEVLAVNERQMMMALHFQDGGRQEGISVYQGIHDEITLNGEVLTADEVAASPEKYGFEKSPAQVIGEDGVLHTYYVKILSDSDDAEAIADSLTINEIPLSRAVSRQSVAQKMQDGLKTATGVMSGTLVVDCAQKAATGNSSEFATQFTCETTKGYLGAKYAKNKLYKAGSGVADKLCSYGEVAVQGLGWYGDLEAIYSSTNPYVTEHSEKIATVATQLWMARATTTLAGGAFIGTYAVSAGGALVAAVAGTGAIAAALPAVVACAAAVGAVYLVSKAIDGVDGWMRAILNGKSDLSMGAFFNYFIDPSGYLYEVIPSNRVKGAKAEIYYQDEDGNAVLWNASDYEQENPQITDDAGWFAWDVPEGKWQVRITAEDYEDYATEWLPVLPVQTDVNIAMVSKNGAELSNITAFGNRVELEFSNFVKDDTLTAEQLFITDAAGNKIAFETELVKEEDNQTAFTRKVVLMANGSVFTGAVLHLDCVCCYNGIAMEKTERILNPDSLYGDLNADNACTIADAVLLAKVVSECPDIQTYQQNGIDQNHDGIVNVMDVVLYLNRFLRKA
ncbi:MAG: leucine-rich repeat protein [Oscillospiraceae bacterium]|nr:leucine-rich repeat protein [Oscillospiraceae bacterium]